VQPLLIQLIERIASLSLKKMVFLLIFGNAAFFALLTWQSLPILVVEIIYMFMCAFSYCAFPAMSNAMGMEYINQGKDLDYGKALGLGTLAGEMCSLIMWYVVEKFSYHALGYVYMAAAVFLLIILAGMEEVKNAVPLPKETKKKGKFMKNLRQKQEFLMIVIGFLFLSQTVLVVDIYEGPKYLLYVYHRSNQQ